MFCRVLVLSNVSDSTNVFFIGIDVYLVVLCDSLQFGQHLEPHFNEDHTSLFLVILYVYIYLECFMFIFLN